MGRKASEALTLRAILAGAACLAALALTIASFSAVSSASGTRSRSATASCKTSSLVLWLNTEGSGAAGSSYYKLKLTNLSAHKCSLKGYPGVSAVNLSGHQLGRPASREHVGKVKSVTLKQGATATAVLRVVNVGNYPSGKCRPTTAAGLRVYPPGQTKSKVVPFPFGACARSGPVYLSVRSVSGG